MVQCFVSVFVLVSIFSLAPSPTITWFYSAEHTRSPVCGLNTTSTRSNLAVATRSRWTWLADIWKHLSRIWNSLTTLGNKLCTSWWLIVTKNSDVLILFFKEHLQLQYLINNSHLCPSRAFFSSWSSSEWLQQDNNAVSIYAHSLTQSWSNRRVSWVQVVSNASRSCSRCCAWTWWNCGGPCYSPTLVERPGVSCTWTPLLSLGTLEKSRQRRHAPSTIALW